MTRPEIISVAIVEDDETVRTTLSLIIDGTPGLVCTGTYPDAESLLHLKRPTCFDVLLLDIGLPGMSGVEAIKPIRNRWKRAEILILTVYSEEDKVFEALCAGATGYLVKNTPPSQLVTAIQEINAGGAPMTASIARNVVRYFRTSGGNMQDLSTRENEVLSKLIDGKTNSQIAEELFISRDTVGFHLKQIYKKLHVHSRAQAVAKALRLHHTW